MTAFALDVIALIGAALLASGAAPHRRAIDLAVSALCAAGALLAAATLVAGAPAAALALPLGLPGAGTRLAADGLSCMFLLLVFAIGAAAFRAGRGAPVLGAMVLTLLADDGFTLAFGVGATGLATAAHLGAGADGRAGLRAGSSRHALRIGMVAALCLVAALSLAGPPAFEAIRSRPPGGWASEAVFALVSLGAAAVAGLPLLTAHAWRAPAALGALLAGAAPALALYVQTRVLFDLCGPGQPAAWGVLLVLFGAALAIGCGARACLAGGPHAAFAVAAGAQLGLTVVALGLAWIARAADLTALAGLALGAALLSATAHALAAALLALCSDAAETGGGSRAFARLGGLIHGMPLTAAATLVGAASLAGLPPSAGFAALWTMVQAIVGAPRVGGFGMQLLLSLAALAMGLATALNAAAVLRAVGIAFLGRPRSPRASAAVETAPPARATLVALAGLLAAAGVFPTAVRALAEPAVRSLLPGRQAGGGTVLTLPGTAGDAGYMAAGITVLLALGIAGAWWSRARATPGVVTGPAWEGGFDAPPPWMPFGDPATQASGFGFSAPLAQWAGRLAGPRLLGRRVRRRAVRRMRALPALSARGRVAAGGGVLAVLLAGVAAALAP